MVLPGASALMETWLSSNYVTLLCATLPPSPPTILPSLSRLPVAILWKANALHTRYKIPLTCNSSAWLYCTRAKLRNDSQNWRSTLRLSFRVDTHDHVDGFINWFVCVFFDGLSFIFFFFFLFAIVSEHMKLRKNSEWNNCRMYVIGKSIQNIYSRVHGPLLRFH